MDEFVVKLDKGKQRAVDINTNCDPWLANLNAAQREAVTWTAEGGLQILAGPGSGKTRVLTCRVANLIKRCGIKPEDLVVVTFTNKAANEMKHRLKGILGEDVTSKIVMGTFHSVAVKYLRKYGKHVDCKNNFLIADSSDCQAILKPIVHKYNATLKDSPINEVGTSQDQVKVKIAQDMISKNKAKGISHSAYLAKVQQDTVQSPWKYAIGYIYTDYEAALRTANTLDFDDLLVFCERLLQKAPYIGKNIAHVLVDEFQDTNSIQYELVKLMASSSGALTIVGDPDQSIYSWRSAETENLQFMLTDFPGTHQVLLEQNYRSTSSILKAALAVVQQDTSRIQKSLNTAHAAGPPVILRKFASAQDEAAYIAYEVKRAVAHTGNQLTYNDFAVLLRYNALSRAIEAALQAASIPSRMVGGHKFFERAEVKDVLAYLQLAENPAYTPAFLRVVNVPKRGIGDTTIKNIIAAAESGNSTCFEVIARSLQGSAIAGIKPVQKSSLRAFAKIILKVGKLARDGASVSTLIDVVVTATDYNAHLERTHGAEHATRAENVNELKTFADQVAQDAGEPSAGTAVPGDGSKESAIVINDSEDTGSPLDIEEAGVDDPDSPLRVFLAASMLSTDTETNDASDGKPTAKVTLTTCHAAKGLEWPVVFLPASETGVYPAFRKTDTSQVAEERRLFYVAMTRAQTMLHMTYAEKRMERGQTEDKSLTEFLQPVMSARKVDFSNETVEFTHEIRSSMSAVLGRRAVADADLHSHIAAFNISTPLPQYTSTEHIHPSERFLTGAYSKPAFGTGGAAWRINAYAGDNAQRYAAQLPNRGQNAYASAFATSQAPGFSSALNMRITKPKSTFAASSSGAMPAASALPGFGQARTAEGKENVLNMFKPFKPPSRVKSDPTTTAALVATIETRLSQQPQAIFVQPAAPTSLAPIRHSLNTSKNEDFASLTEWAKADNDDSYLDPPLPINGWTPSQKRSAVQAKASVLKRTRS